MKLRKSIAEQRRQLAGALALMLQRLNPALPESRRRDFLVEAIASTGRSMIEIGVDTVTVAALLNKIDADVAEILAASPRDLGGETVVGNA